MTIINQTLKNEAGRWSKMALIIASAWLVVLFMALWDFFENGLRYDVWVFLASVAVGTKYINAHATKVEKTPNEKPV